MKSQLGQETDEENCDDPIRLFDSDVNAVYFGSQPQAQSTQHTAYHWQFENNEFCQLRENSTLSIPGERKIGEQSQTLDGNSTSECDISPLWVKLVDCGKFPWYFRKYTQQILQKTNLNKLSDSDQEDVDVVGIEDSDLNDCFIVEDLQDVTNKISDNQLKDNSAIIIPTKPQISKINTDKNLETMMRRRVDVELKRAISQKNLAKVDLKRNQGLVGMKIAQKVMKNATLDVKTVRTNEAKESKTKQDGIIAVESYISAADKTLSHIGTQLIPIVEEKESNFICQSKIKIVENDMVMRIPTFIKPTCSRNVPVQTNITKVSEKPVDNTKTKQNNDLSSETKLKSEMANKSILIDLEKKWNLVNEKELSCKVATPVKSPNPSNTFTSNVKDVKKTNKYKNDQLKNLNKASHSSLIGLLVLKQNKEEIKEKKYTKQYKKIKCGTKSKVAELDKKPNKKVEKQKREVKSPILTCSTVSKKPKYKHELPSKCNKSDTNNDNISNKFNNLNRLVSKLTNINNSNAIQQLYQPNNVIPKSLIVSKVSDVFTKQTLQKESGTILEKTATQVSDIHEKSSKASSNHLKKCNDAYNTYSKTNNLRDTRLPSSHNKTSTDQHISYDTHQDTVNKCSINAVSETNPSTSTPIKNIKPTVCNSNFPTATVVTPTSEFKSISNEYTNYINSFGPQLSSTMSRDNIPNNNINASVQNCYASAIILKPNSQTNYPVGKNHERPVQAMAPQLHQRSNNLPIHTQPRFQDLQHLYPQYYQSTPSSRQRSNVQSSVKSVLNRSHLPKDNDIVSNPMHNIYRGCWLSKNLAHPPPPPLSVPPPPLSVPPPPPSVPPPPPPSVPEPTLPKNDYGVNKTKSSSCLNPPQHQQRASIQSSVNTLHTRDSSIIGVNNEGLVKKINIVAGPVAKNVNAKKETVNVEVKVSQFMTPLRESEVVTTKMEMLEELDKLSFADNSTSDIDNLSINDLERIHHDGRFNDTKQENTFEVAIMSKKPGTFETLKLTVDQKNNFPRTYQAKGYSPPILPIPTYQKVLDRVVTNSQAQNATPKIAVRAEDPRKNSRNESKPLRKRDFVRCCKRKLSNTFNKPDDSRKKYDAKKISLEEYKKRIFKNDRKSEHSSKKMCKEKYNNSGKRPVIEYKYRENVDYSTETDLGYDSDSTVVL